MFYISTRLIDEIDYNFKKFSKYSNSKEWMKRLKTQYDSIYLCKYKTNLTLLRAALKYIKDQLEPMNKKHKEKRSQIWKTLTEFSTYNIKSLDNHISNCTTPSIYLEYKVIKIMKDYKRRFPQSSIDGSTNIWVMKPSYSSRGIGIKCLRDIKEIRAREQAKIIQKYIENPFLLKIQGPLGKLEQRKFDIRQWVLVTSMNPLVTYMFDTCYLRICGSEFSLEDTKDNYKHLSNYSLQKNNNRIQDTSQSLIMNLQQFTDHLKVVYDIDFSWYRDMFPKIADIVKNTLYSGCDVIEHNPHCFELYGFDFVLDDKLNPWLIEVNSSPACSERTSWLSDMLGKVLSK